MMTGRIRTIPTRASRRGRMGARIWLTRPSTQWTWRRERLSRSRYTATIQETVAEAGERTTTVFLDADSDDVVKQVSADGPREVVTDKGYHSRATRREAGAMESTLVRSGRDASDAFARPGKHSQAAG